MRNYTLKAFFAFIAIMFCSSISAQQLKVCQKDGTVVTYDLSNIDSLVFIEKSASEEITEETLYGTWVYESKENYTETYIFNSNGSATHIMKGVQNSTDTFKYKFNPKTLEITITESNGEVWTDKFDSLTSTTLVWDRCKFIKQ